MAVMYIQNSNVGMTTEANPSEKLDLFIQTWISKILKIINYRRQDQDWSLR